MRDDDDDGNLSEAEAEGPGACIGCFVIARHIKSVTAFMLIEFGVIVANACACVLMWVCVCKTIKNGIEADIFCCLIKTLETSSSLVHLISCSYVTKTQFFSPLNVVDNIRLDLKLFYNFCCCFLLSTRLSTSFIGKKPNSLEADSKICSYESTMRSHELR